MQFSVGIFDALFGRKIEVQIPGPDGAEISRRVSQKWFDSMIHTGEIKPLESVRVNIFHPAGNYAEDWIIGHRVDQESVDKFKDKVTGELYAVTHLKNRQPETFPVVKSIYDQVIIDTL